MSAMIQRVSLIIVSTCRPDFSLKSRMATSRPTVHLQDTRSVELRLSAHRQIAHQLLIGHFADVHHAPPLSITVALPPGHGTVAPPIADTFLILPDLRPRSACRQKPTVYWGRVVHTTGLPARGASDSDERHHLARIQCLWVGLQAARKDPAKYDAITERLRRESGCLPSEIAPTPSDALKGRVAW